jgi:hypothetical protein
MQIQSGEGGLWRRAETVAQRARRDTMRPEIGYCEKVPRRGWLGKLEEEICSAAKRKSPERAETRGGFELERVVSCRSHDHWWRTKLDFGSGESFDDLH